MVQVGGFQPSLLEFLGFPQGKDDGNDDENENGRGKKSPDHRGRDGTHDIGTRPCAPHDGHESDEIDGHRHEFGTQTEDGTLRRRCIDLERCHGATGQAAIERFIQIHQHDDTRLGDLAQRKQEALDRRKGYEVELVKSKEEYSAAHQELEALYSTNQETAKKGTELRTRYNAVKDQYNEFWREKLRIQDASHRAEDKLNAWKTDLENHREGIRLLEKRGGKSGDWQAEKQ